MPAAACRLQVRPLSVDLHDGRCVVGLSLRPARRRTVARTVTVTRVGMPAECDTGIIPHGNLKNCVCASDLPGLSPDRLEEGFKLA